jgi:hypothetical protein
MGFWTIGAGIILAFIIYRLYKQREYILSLGVLTERSLGIKESVWTRISDRMDNNKKRRRKK